MVQAMRVYLTVDGNTSCPTDFLPVGISHYQTMNTVASLSPCLIAGIASTARKDLQARSQDHA